MGPVNLINKAVRIELVDYSKNESLIDRSNSNHEPNET